MEFNQEQPSLQDFTAGGNFLEKQIEHVSAVAGELVNILKEQNQEAFDKVIVRTNTIKENSQLFESILRVNPQEVNKNFAINKEKKLTLEKPSEEYKKYERKLENQEQLIRVQKKKKIQPQLEKNGQTTSRKSDLGVTIQAVETVEQ